MYFDVIASIKVQESASCVQCAVCTVKRQGLHKITCVVKIAKYTRKKTERQMNKYIDRYERKKDGQIEDRKIQRQQNR